MKILITFFLLLIQTHSFAVDSDSFYYGKSLEDKFLKEYDSQVHYKFINKSKYVRLMLARLLENCLREICLNEEKDILLAKQIYYIAQNYESAGVLFFANEQGEFFPKLNKKNESALHQVGLPTLGNIFISKDTNNTRNAISSLGIGAIIFNVDKKLKLIDLFKVMIHEFGHQTGIPDTDERELDYFANKFDSILHKHILKTQLGEITIYNHFSMKPGIQPIFKNQNILKDTDNYWLPQILYESPKYFINLTPHIKKVLHRFIGVSNIANIWVNSLAITKTDFGFILNGVMGQLNPVNGTVIKPQLKNGLLIQGNLEIAYNTKTNMIRVNFTNIKNFAKFSNIRAKILKIKDLNKGQNPNLIDIKIKLKLPEQEKIKSCEMQSSKISDLSPDSFYPRYFILDCQKISNESPGIWTVRLRFETPKNFFKSEIQLLKLVLNLDSQIDPIYTYPKEIMKFNLGTLVQKNTNLTYQQVYITTLKGFLPSLDMFKPNDFIPLSFFKKGSINGIHQFLSFKNIDSTIFNAKLMLFVQIISDDPNYTKSKVFFAKDILYESKDETKGQEREFTLSIDPFKLGDHIKSVRLLGISFITKNGSIKTIKFIKTNRLL